MLRRIPLLAELGDGGLQELARRTRFIGLDDGQALFEQGDPAEAFFHVLEGRIKLYRLSPDGHEKVVEIIQAGQSFAEAVMFMEGRAYPVSSEAIGTTRLVAVENEAFRRLLVDSNELCLRLLSTLSRRLHHHLGEIDALALQNARLRLVNYLLQQMPPGAEDGACIELPAQKKVIAARLSVQPETFSRSLNQLAQAGIIAVDGGEVVVRDVARLRDLSLGEEL